MLKRSCVKPEIGIAGRNASYGVFSEATIRAAARAAIGKEHSTEVLSRDFSKSFNQVKNLENAFAVSLSPSSIRMERKRNMTER